MVAKHSKTEVFLDSDQLEDLDLIFAPGLVFFLGGASPRNSQGTRENQFKSGKPEQV